VGNPKFKARTQQNQEFRGASSGRFLGKKGTARCAVPLDVLRGTIDVAETFSDGQFGSPKTRSSRRVIPVSDSLRKTFEAHRTRSLRTDSEGLVFTTPKGTPLSSKDLYNRENLLPIVTESVWYSVLSNCEGGQRSLPRPIHLRKFFRL